jgi:hypothetical protein
LLAGIDHAVAAFFSLGRVAQLSRHSAGVPRLGDAFGRAAITVVRIGVVAGFVAADRAVAARAFDGLAVVVLAFVRLVHRPPVGDLDALGDHAPAAAATTARTAGGLFELVAGRHDHGWVRATVGEQTDQGDQERTRAQPTRPQ